MQMDLRPSILDDLGILATLSWFCREFQKIYSHLQVQNQIDIQEQDVPEPLKIVIFRVLQEAMNNIAKHSRGEQVSLALRRINGTVVLTIRDNGIGFDLKNSRRGLGLSSMKERAELSGGSFTVESSIGKGTLIRASWPLD